MWRGHYACTECPAYLAGNPLTSTGCPGDEFRMDIFIAVLSGLTESSTVFARYGEFERGPENHTHPTPEAAGPAQPVSIVEGGKKKVKRPRSEKRKQQPLKSFQQRAKEVLVLELLLGIVAIVAIVHMLFNSFMHVKVIPHVLQTVPIDTCTCCLV